MNTVQHLYKLGGLTTEGPLISVLVAAKCWHVRGIRTGLTRIRRGFWRIDPRIPSNEAVHGQSHTIAAPGA